MVEKRQELQDISLDKEWLERAEWRKANGDWLDISFRIGVKVSGVLSRNKSLNKSPKNQEELADDMYCSPYLIERILKGEEDLNLSMIVRLSKVLGVNLIQAL